MNFEEAIEKSKHINGEVTEQERCEFYALHKQATEGDAKGEAPSGEEAKFDAWKAKAGMSKEDAKAAFIKAVEEAITKYGMQSQ